MKNCIIPAILFLILGYSVDEVSNAIFDYYSTSQPDVNEIKIKVLEYSE